MTFRVYLAAGTVKFDDSSPQPSDLPTERIFVNASDVPEIWVETESSNVPDVGRSTIFSLARPLPIGFSRIRGTVERKVRKQGT